MKRNVWMVMTLCLVFVSGCGTVTSDLTTMSAPDRVQATTVRTATPESSLIIVVESSAGTADHITSTAAGAVEPYSTVKVYPENQTTPVAMFEGTADANGEFDIAIGDNVLDSIVLTATAPQKTESAGIALVNDVFN